MLKISHIKIKPINIVLLLILSILPACYMPGGGFMVHTEDRVVVDQDSVFVSLPTDYQAYNYFKVSYAKKMEVFVAEKANDTTIVFISNTIKSSAKITPFRVEYGIQPFYKKNKNL